MKTVDLVANVSDMLGWGDVKSVAGEDPSVRKILRHANLVLSSMQGERNWKELDETSTVLVQASTTVTIAFNITYGDIKIFLLGFRDEAVEYVGGLIRMNGQKEWYRIVSIDDKGYAFIDRPYIGDDITAVEVDIDFARDTYHLPDNYDRMTSKRMYCRAAESYVDLVDDTELDMDREAGLLMQQPTKFSIRGRSPNGKPTMIFNFLPDDTYLYNYSYQKDHPALEHDDDEVLYPNRYSLAIIDQIVSRLNREVEDQQKSMADTAAALSEKVKQGANPDSGERRVRMTPWTGRARRRA